MNDMSSHVYRAIKSEIEKIIESEAKEAAKRVETRIRESIGSIAAKVLQHFTFNQFGTELRITVDFENIKE